MIITIVMDQYSSANNGSTISTMRFADVLKKHGHTVRILTSNTVAKTDTVFTVPCLKIPIFNGIIQSQGMIFGKPDDEVIRKAISGADIVHLMFPFPLQIRTRELCDELNIPYTAAFHCQPQNITYTIYMNSIGFVNSLVFRYFKRKLYKHVKHIHCPSEMIKNELIKHHYDNEFHVISNGASPFFKPMNVARPEEYKDKFIICSVGRYSREKRHDVIINAIAKSKYKKHIKLILCGKGPRKSKYESYQMRLENPIELKFCSQEELREVLNYSDLYVHSSDAEIEGMSCIEAFTTGLVPIISNSKLSATKDFALCEECIFQHGSSKDLAKKIDYMIEHPDFLKSLSPKYVELAKKFEVDKSVREIEKVFMLAIEENKRKINGTNTIRKNK